MTIYFHLHNYTTTEFEFIESKTGFSSYLLIIIAQYTNLWHL